MNDVQMSEKKMWKKKKIWINNIKTGQRVIK